MTTYTDTQVFIAIESLLRTSGHCGQLVSVVSEASRYCYKTVDGTIGTVDQAFIHDRCDNSRNTFEKCRK